MSGWRSWSAARAGRTRQAAYLTTFAGDLGARGRSRHADSPATYTVELERHHQNQSIKQVVIRLMATQPKNFNSQSGAGQEPTTHSNQPALG